MSGLLELLPKDTPVTEYRTPRGPRIFQTYVSHPTIREAVVRSLADASELTIEWSSVWADLASEPELRPPTPLTSQTQELLLADLAAENADGYGRRYLIAARASKDGRFGVSNVHPVDPVVSIFLQTGEGLDWLIYQCNDSPEYVFVSRQLSLASNRLLDDAWGLFALAKPQSSLWTWVRRTVRDGTLPP